ncbi:protein kilB [Streptomyces cinnabarinus]|uniref:Protein kilB n=1 Tax=Streptomyces cinnabarinus TaxID=67287 RepID=A0ABY7KF63_9ACTN|nr:protein kilB [Streptomyces cinnabarinus]WAZ23177.1 protein kilB [Streptomyces cinnabarinus]
MITTLIAVLGTLAGAVVAGLMQHLTSTRTARAAEAERRRQALAAAVPALLAALVGHRERQYLKIVARREGREDSAEARQARYAARSAVTSAMDGLYMATDNADLLAVAQEAVDAAMALGDVPDAEVDAAGLLARETHTALRVVGAGHVHA